MSTNPDPRLQRALAEPYAFVLLLWPAVIGVRLLDAPEGDALYRYLLYAWLAIIHLAAYRQGRGSGFGNILLLLSLCVALACRTFPSPWTLAWLPLLLTGLLAAQQSRLRCLLGQEAGPKAAEGNPSMGRDPEP